LLIYHKLELRLDGFGDSDEEVEGVEVFERERVLDGDKDDVR